MAETKTYPEKLKSPKWQKKRLEVLNRDNFTCQHCGDTETELHVHHLKYSREPHEAPLEDLATLCKICHKFETFEEFESPPKKYVKYTSAMVILLENGSVVLYDTENNELQHVVTFDVKNNILKKLYDLNNL